MVGDNVVLVVVALVVVDDVIDVDDDVGVGVVLAMNTGLVLMHCRSMGKAIDGCKDLRRLIV